MRFNRVFLGMFLILLAAGRLARAETVDEYIKSEMGRQRIPGLSLAIVQDGKVVKVQGYGVADVEKKTPVTADTAYDVGPVAKSFTATAMLMLMQNGRIRPADKMARFFSNVPPQWRDITVWHLLTNTSGIKDYLTETPTTATLDFTPDIVYNRAIGAGLNFTPGTQFKYSNTNYVMLGMVIEAATGRPFYEFIVDRIFKPLGMTESTLRASGKPVPNLATGYQLTNGQATAVDAEKRAFADAFLCTTVNDLSRWAAALDSDGFLTWQMRATMWSPTPLMPAGKQPATAEAKPKTAPYGVGWYTETLKGRPVIGEGGSSGGCSANLSRFPDDRLTVIVLANLRNVDALPLVQGIATRYLSALKEERSRVNLSNP